MNASFMTSLISDISEMSTAVVSSETTVTPTPQGDSLKPHTWITELLETPQPVKETLSMSSHTPSFTTQDPTQDEDFDSEALSTWANFFGLNIPVDPQGYKRYTTEHLRIFRAVRKLLQQGRTLENIREALFAGETTAVSPPQTSLKHYVAQHHAQLDEATTPVSSVPMAEALPSISHDMIPKPIARKPSPSPETIPEDAIRLGQRCVQTTSTQYTQAVSTTTTPHTTLPQLVSTQETIEHLQQECKLLQERLIESEKRNSHLFQTNEAFTSKLETLEVALQQAKEKSKEGDIMKLLEDKARLQKDLIETRKVKDTIEKHAYEWQAHAELLETALQTLSQPSLETFYGVWQECVVLQEVLFDEVGIQMDARRERTVVLEAGPLVQQFGNALMLTTQYHYDNNPHWERRETSLLVLQANGELAGPLFVEYWFEKRLMAKALYRFSACRSEG
ncbi:MAG: helix-turn-helix domain-containing protein [Vampirovibrionales bacterium]